MSWLIFIRNVHISDEEELHEGTAEVLLGLTCLAFAGEGDLAVLDVSKGAVGAGYGIVAAVHEYGNIDAEVRRKTGDVVFVLNAWHV